MMLLLLVLLLLLLLLVLLAENMTVTVKRYMVEQKKWRQVARKFNIFAPGWCLAKQNLFSAQTCTLFLWKWGSMRLECSEKYKSELLL